MKQAVIIGGGAKAKCFDYALIDDKDVEIWGINAIRYDWVPRWDRMFNLHRYALLQKYGWPCWKDAEWAASHKDVPFYTMDEWPDGRMTRSKRFPFEMLMHQYPRGRYHCNSFDWLIAYALFERFSVLHLHGCTLVKDGMMEQMSASRCAEYWAGYAEGQGMKVKTYEDCDLFNAWHLVRSDRTYGLDDSPPWEDRRANAPYPDGQPFRYDGY